MKSLFLLSMLVLMTSCGFEIVDNGHRGIKVSMGEVVGEPLNPGFHTYNPFGTDVLEVNVKDQAYDYELECYSKDNQPIDMKVTVAHAPVGTEVGRIYAVKGDVEDYMVGPITKEITSGIKDIVGQYQADTIVSQRGKLQTEMLKYLKAKLAESKVNVATVDITDLKFEPAYEQAVQEKVVAIQKFETAKNNTDRIREEKDQAILTAQGAAEAMRIKANALASNPKLVEYEWVQKWDGHDNRTHVFSNGQAISIMTK